MQQENNILVLKDVIKGLGANKTIKAIVCASGAAPAVAGTEEKLYEHYLVHIKKWKAQYKRQCEKCNISCKNNRSNRPI